MRLPRTMGRPDTFPGIRSISSHSVQSISVSVLAVLFTLLILSTLKLPQQHRSLLRKAHDKSKALLADEMIEMLSREISPLIEIPHNDSRAPATDYRFADGIRTVGFVASVSRPFCMNCNRLRLTADGKLRYCLFAIDETDVKGILRNGGSDEEIAATIRANVKAKWSGHEINNTVKFVPPPRPMYAIGG